MSVKCLAQEHNAVSPDRSIRGRAHYSHEHRASHDSSNAVALFQLLRDQAHHSKFHSSRTSAVIMNLPAPIFTPGWGEAL